jgi:hypothetical protein
MKHRTLYLRAAQRHVRTPSQLAREIAADEACIATIQARLNGTQTWQHRSDDLHALSDARVRIALARAQMNAGVEA